MKPKVCEKCDKISASQFCPDCGTELATSKSAYPYEFIKYVHGDRGDESIDEMLEELGIDEDSNLASDIYRCDYEVKLHYVIKEDESIELIGVDDKMFK